MNKNYSPECGQSDERNIKYNEVFSPKKLFNNICAVKDPVILDIGAHEGETIKYFSNIFSGFNIYSVEPDPDNFKTLRKVVENLQSKAVEYKIKTFNCAISDIDGPIDFYKQTISHLSSCKPINKNSVDSLGYAKNAPNKKISVPCNTLDTFCSQNNITEVDILKIDTQGSELNVLQGATDTLRRSSVVIVEINLFDFYEVSSSLLNVEQIMHLSGLTLYDISKISKNPMNFRTDWIECIYKR